MINERRISRQYNVALNRHCGKLEGKRELCRPRHRWEDNITQVLKESGRTNVSLMHLNLDTENYPNVVTAIINHRVQYNVGNFVNSRATLRYCRINQLHALGW